MRHSDLIAGLKDRTAINSPRIRNILVAAEIAISVMLLAGAGLLLKTMQRIGSIDPGFHPDHLLVLRAPVPRATDRDHAESYYGELQTRLAALPGVQSMALSTFQPLTGLQRREPFAISGRDDQPEAEYDVVTPGYFTNTRHSDSERPSFRLSRRPQRGDERSPRTKILARGGPDR